MYVPCWVTKSFARQCLRAANGSKQTRQVLLQGSRKWSWAAGLIWTSAWRRFNPQIHLIQRLCRLVSLFSKGLKSVEGASRGLCIPRLRVVKSRLLSLDRGVWACNNGGRFWMCKSEQRCLRWLPLSLGWNPRRIWCASSLGNFSSLSSNHLHASCRSQQPTFPMWVITPMQG